MANFNTASLLGTNVAWLAGHKALGYAKDKWGIDISGSRKDSEIREFLLDNIGTATDEDLSNEAKKIMTFTNLKKDNGIKGEDEVADGNSVEMVLSYNKLSVDGSIITKGQTTKIEEWVEEGVDEDGNEITTSSSSSYNVPIVKPLDKFGMNSFYINDVTSSQPFVGMFLRVQGFDTTMLLPCVDGSPKITMQVVHNEMPTASNELVTTNRRIKPMVFRFSFPMAYLRIYGKNAYNAEVRDARSKLTKAKDYLKEKWNNLNPIDFFDMETAKHQVMDRQIPTYAETLNALSKFPRQFGCTLYTGIFNSPISVTCSIEIQSQKGDMDCVWVDMTLVESIEFNFYELKTESVFDWQNKQSIAQAEANGSKVNDGTKEVKG